MNAPPVLTVERIDAMLSVMAEVCFEAVVEAGQRQKQAEDFEDFERSGRALQRACRNLRQTIALKQRFDREEARKAEVVRGEAERERRGAVARHQTRVRRHFEQTLWDEYEADDALALSYDLEERLGDLAEDPDFLETPAETLIARLAVEIGLGDAPPPRDDAAAAVDVAPERAVVEPHASASPDVFERPEPPVQARPPDPPPDPEPYIPPWERLAPGQRPPGGTGW